MTIAELMIKLGQFPQDAVVYRRCDEEFHHFMATATSKREEWKNCMDTINGREVRRGIIWNYKIIEEPKEPYLPGFSDEDTKITSILL